MFKVIFYQQSDDCRQLFLGRTKTTAVFLHSLYIQRFCVAGVCPGILEMKESRFFVYQHPDIKPGEVELIIQRKPFDAKQASSVESGKSGR